MVQQRLREALRRRGPEAGAPATDREGASHSLVALAGEEQSQALLLLGLRVEVLPGVVVAPSTSQGQLLAAQRLRRRVLPGQVAGLDGPDAEDVLQAQRAVIQVLVGREEVLPTEQALRRPEGACAFAKPLVPLVHVR